MPGWLERLKKKWDDWCGDHEMETSIRTHLTANGYFGSTAKFKAVRLVAVQRPGWLQLFRFEVTARINLGENEEGADAAASYDHLYGLVREDKRHNRSDVRVFHDESQRQEIFTQWSEGLICLRGAKGLVTSGDSACQNTLS